MYIPYSKQIRDLAYVAACGSYGSRGEIRAYGVKSRHSALMQSESTGRPLTEERKEAGRIVCTVSPAAPCLARLSYRFDLMSRADDV